MQDREFEKQVQQKMQELRFAPGSDVWARVQADLQRKKRRRPVIIWFLLAGLFIGGGYFVMSGLNDKQQVTVAERNNTIKNSDRDNNDIRGTNTSPNKKAEAKSIPGPDDPQTATTNESKTTEQVSPRNQTPAGNTTDLVTKKNENKAQKPTGSSRLISRYTGSSHSVPERQVVDKKPLSGKTIASKEITADRKDTKTEIKPASKSPEAIDDGSNDIVNKSSEPVSTSKPTTELQQGNELKPPAGQQQNQPASDSTGSGVAMKNKPAGKKKLKLQFGISAGAGISDLGKELFQKTSVADFAAGSGSVSPTAPPMYRPAEVDPGFAFHAGAHVSTDVSRKLRLQAGVLYQQFTNRIRVGTYYGMERLVNQGASLNVVREFYASGNQNSFTNRYHFISLPVSLQWQVYSHRRFGIVWENGIAPSWLAGSNALHFDGVTGSYYKDNSLLRKTQWIASSSVLFSVMKGKNVQLLAGPQLQYGLSNLVSDDAGNNKHLRYGGIRLTASFNK